MIYKWFIFLTLDPHVWPSQPWIMLNSRNPNLRAHDNEHCYCDTLDTQSLSLLCTLTIDFVTKGLLLTPITSFKSLPWPPRFIFNTIQLQLSTSFNLFPGLRSSYSLLFLSILCLICVSYAAPSFSYSYLGWSTSTSLLRYWGYPMSALYAYWPDLATNYFWVLPLYYTIYHPLTEIPIKGRSALYQVFGYPLAHHRVLPSHQSMVAAYKPQHVL